MQKLISSLPFFRDARLAKERQAFLNRMERQGIYFSHEDIPSLVGRAGVAVLDSSLLTEDIPSVQLVAAPLELTPVSHFRRQSAWMMLGACVALSCEGCVPLEHFAESISFSSARMARQFPLVSSRPWDDRGLSTGIHRDADGLRAYTQGSLSQVLARCTQILDGHERPLTPMDHRKIIDSAKKIAEEGLDVLAYATRRLSSSVEDAEQNMTFLGLLGVGDQARPDAARGVRSLASAGLRPVALSSHHLSPRVLRDCSLSSWGGKSISGSIADAMDDWSLRSASRQAYAFDGIAPQRQERILRALSAETEATLAVGFSSPADISVSLCGEKADVSITRGSLEALSRLVLECRVFVQ